VVQEKKGIKRDGKNIGIRHVGIKRGGYGCLLPRGRKKTTRGGKGKMTGTLAVPLQCRRKTVECCLGEGRGGEEKRKFKKKRGGAHSQSFALIEKPTTGKRRKNGKEGKGKLGEQSPQGFWKHISIWERKKIKLSQGGERKKSVWGGGGRCAHGGGKKK